MKTIFTIALLAVSGVSNAACLGSTPQCEAQAWQQYRQQYQTPQYQQQPVAPQQNWNSSFGSFGQQQPAPVNENGFDRYGHYHPSY